MSYEKDYNTTPHLYEICKYIIKYSEKHFSTSVDTDPYICKYITKQSEKHFPTFIDTDP